MVRICSFEFNISVSTPYSWNKQRIIKSKTGEQDTRQSEVYEAGKADELLSVVDGGLRHPDPDASFRCRADDVIFPPVQVLQWAQF